MTREQWKERLPLIQAFVEGKEIEGRITENGPWGIYDNPAFDNHVSCYRIAPEHKLRPWKPEEVPVGALIKQAGDSLGRLILSVDEQNRIWIGRPDGEPYLFVKDAVDLLYVHSLDHGKTWLPCGVVE